MDSAPNASILFLTSSLTIGGSEAKTVRLANSLADRGHDVTIAFLNEPRSLASEVSRKVQLRHLDRRGKFSLSAVRRLTGILRSAQTRNIVAVNLYPTLYAALAVASFRPSVRLLASINTTEFVTRKEAMQMTLYRHVLRRFDTLIFGARVQRDIWCRRYRLGPPRQAATVLYNGVDTGHFVPSPDASRAVGLPNTRYLIGTVGKMRREKAHIDLISALAKLRGDGLDVGAVIVGDGPEMPRLRAEVARRGMAPYVALPGECLDVRPYLRSMDVFAITSVAVETFSNAALEAMAAGCAIVSSTVGGMSEMLQFGGGVTYIPGRVDLLSERLAALLLNPAELQRTRGQARDLAVREFSWDSMVRRFESLLSTS